MHRPFHDWELATAHIEQASPHVIMTLVLRFSKGIVYCLDSSCADDAGLDSAHLPNCWYLASPASKCINTPINASSSHLHVSASYIASWLQPSFLFEKLATCSFLHVSSGSSPVNMRLAPQTRFRSATLPSMIDHNVYWAPQAFTWLLRCFCSSGLEWTPQVFSRCSHCSRMPEAKCETA
jgi:hypothetical protein